MQQGQAAMAAGDAAQLAQIGQQMTAAGYAKEGQALTQAAMTAKQKKQTGAAIAGLLTPEGMQNPEAWLAAGREISSISPETAIDFGKQASQLESKKTALLNERAAVIGELDSYIHSRNVPEKFVQLAANLKRAYYSSGQNPKTVQAGLEALRKQAYPEIETGTFDEANPDGTTTQWLINKETGDKLRSLGITKRPSAKEEEQRVLLQNADDRQAQAKVAFLAETDNQKAKIEKAKQLLSGIDKNFFNRYLVRAAQDPNSTLVAAAFPEFITLKDTVDSIKAGLGLETILLLKQAGGGSTGLGAVSNIELQALQSKIATLNPTNLVDLENTLAEIENHYNNVVSIMSGGTPNINWDDPSYSNITKVIKGKRYIKTGTSSEDWYEL